MRDERERLRDIRDAIDQIAKYSVDGQQRFLDDELIQVWTIHHLQIIGEAANALSPEIKRELPGFPWSDIIGMRHLLVHQYFRIALAVVWETVARDLPVLRKSIAEYLAQPPN